MTAQKFVTKPEWYRQNQREAKSLRVLPAIITPPSGEGEPGVAIIRWGQVKLALTEEQAYTLANGIADALESNRTN